MFKIVAVYAICCCSSVVSDARNNVCKTINDYATIDYNKNCWYDPDVSLTPGQLIQRYGYPLEKYKVTTEDGYILTLFRIPNNGTNKGLKRQPILLQHGIAVHSVVWLLVGKKSLPFILANNGFDVWLSNFRGTRFSAKHIKYTMNDPEYWNFSFHELGLYDLAAVSKFIKEKTSQKMIYIGHSMGTTSAFVYASVRKKHAHRNLKSIVALAPVAYVNNVGGSTRAIVPFTNLIWYLSSQLGIYAIGQFTKFQQQTIGNLCMTYPTIILCETINAFISGLELQEVTPEHFPLFFFNYPTGTSVKTLVHFAQNIQTNHRFSWFNYGKNLNLLYYKSKQPPEYNISEINIPVHLLYGKKDLLSNPLDVYYLYNKLRTKKSITSALENKHIYFSHNDFLLGSHIDILNLYLLRLIKSIK